MPKTEHPLEALKQYIPLQSFEPIVAFIQQYKIHLTVAKTRKSILGDYRHPQRGNNHKISVNGNLNNFEFLITLLHEIAHLLTYEKYGNKVESHGNEWKHFYSQLLIDFIDKDIFPLEIKNELNYTIKNPAATANGETRLLKVLRQFNPKKEGIATVEELAIGSVFLTEKGKFFKKGIQRRKRFECLEISSGKRYSFSAIAEVKFIRLEERY
jgi:SprT protein